MNEADQRANAAGCMSLVFIVPFAVVGVIVIVASTAWSTLAGIPALMRVHPRAAFQEILVAACFAGIIVFVARAIFDQRQKAGER
jgi:uncharacterized membrane protein (DUF485 family)